MWITENKLSRDCRHPNYLTASTDTFPLLCVHFKVTIDGSAYANFWLNSVSTPTIFHNNHRVNSTQGSTLCRSSDFKHFFYENLPKNQLWNVLIPSDVSPAISLLLVLQNFQLAGNPISFCHYYEYSLFVRKLLASIRLQKSLTYCSQH